MNKVPNPVKMEYKGQRTILVVVLVGMVFLGPGITEKALAGSVSVRAKADGLCGAVDAAGRSPAPCEFTFVSKEISSTFGAGNWTSGPTVSGTSATWAATGTGDDVKGSVTYKVVEAGSSGSSIKAELFFWNTNMGQKSCSIKTTPSTSGQSCTASRGNPSDITYNLKLY